MCKKKREKKKKGGYKNSFHLGFAIKKIVSISKYDLMVLISEIPYMDA
jgi:hypothetical protein